jgi:hypothetical protein
MDQYDDRVLTQDEYDALVLQNGARSEKIKVLQERNKPQKIGVGSKYGRQ